ncbi:MAG: energy transducer TonB, partial [Pseudomonadota bacterium]
MSSSRSSGLREKTLTVVSVLLVGLVALAGFSSAARANLPEADPVPEIINVDGPIADTPEGAELLSLTARYQAQATAGETEEALELAKQIVAVSSQLWGEQSPQLASALTNLAIAQIDAGDIEAAQQNFLGAISMRELYSSSIIDPELMNPLRGLAKTMVAMNAIEEAIPVYERAIHVSHVNLGPNNLEQMDLMGALSRAYFELGEVRDSGKIRDNLYRLQLRNFDKESDQYLDAVLSRARWFASIGDFNSSLLAYKRYFTIVNSRFGKDDKRLVMPMVELAFVTDDPTTTERGDLSAQVQQREKERAIARATRVAEAHKDEDPVLYAQTMAKKGDFAIAFPQIGTPRNARIPYRIAWETLSKSPELIRVRDELFEEPVAVRLVPIVTTPDNTTNSRQEMALYQERGFVNLSFDVNRFGRPVNIAVIESEPAGLMDGIVIRRFRNYRFRPAIRNGSPVATTGMSFRHDFR